MEKHSAQKKVDPLTPGLADFYCDGIGAIITLFISGRDDSLERTFSIMNILSSLYNEHERRTKDYEFYS
jgi:hypothetical protein